MTAFEITRIGAVALDLLGECAGGEAEVVGLFERSFYLLTDAGYVCIGNSEIGDGPINLVTEALSGDELKRLGVFPEAKARVTSGSIEFDDSGHSFGFADAQVWTPPPWPLPVPNWATTLAELRALIARSAPREGLARAVLDPAYTATHEAQSAQGSLSALRQDMPAALRSGATEPELHSAATLLVGLGPGLTPSGDDVLGGLFLALTAVNQRPIRDALWESIGPELEHLTVPISAMHLALAADGQAAAALHQVVGAVLGGSMEEVRTAVVQAGKIGASSGWDGMAGVLLALECLRQDR